MINSVAPSEEAPPWGAGGGSEVELRKASTTFTRRAAAGGYCKLHAPELPLF